jgi:8-oxo-dGTP pyrophosphatase MutT (NUDIX family)
MSKVVGKVTAFVTRRTKGGDELLLFKHPYAGIQIPAGTIEPDERPEAAVLREAREETGLWPLSISAYLGSREIAIPEGWRILAARTTVYARPDVTSFDWAYLPRGAWVTVGRSATGFTQVTYEEPDRVPDSQYISMCITGWVPDQVLSDRQERHFFRLEYHGPPRERWTVFVDNHTYALFWASLASLPEIIPPQDQWLAFLDAALIPGKKAPGDGLREADG